MACDVPGRAVYGGERFEHSPDQGERHACEEVVGA